MEAKSEGSISFSYGGIRAGIHWPWSKVTSDTFRTTTGPGICGSGVLRTHCQEESTVK